MKGEEKWEGKIMTRKVGREEEGKVKGKIRRKRRSRRRDGGGGGGGGGGGCQLVKTHFGWPVVADATQKVEGIQKIPLHPVNHPKTVCLIRVFLWGREDVGQNGSHTLSSMFSPALEHTTFSLSSHPHNQGNHAPPTVAPAAPIIMLYTCSILSSAAIVY